MSYEKYRFYHLHVFLRSANVTALSYGGKYTKPKMDVNHWCVYIEAN